MLNGEVVWQASDFSLSKDLHGSANCPMTYLVTFKFDLRCVEVSDGEVARLRGEEDVGVRSIRVADVVI